MATTTPNYGWDVPTSTDYVGQGALAIETLGDDIDASLFSITGGKNVGMVHLSTTTITATTGATISNVFSSSYDTYKIVLNGTSASGQQDVFYQNTLAGTPAAGAGTYKYGSFYQAQSINAYGSNFYSSGNSSAIIGQFTATTNTNDLWTFDVSNPGQARFTSGAGIGAYGGTATFAAFQHTVATAYDGCKIFCGGNWTGTIRIYGYRNA